MRETIGNKSSFAQARARRQRKCTGVRIFRGNGSIAQADAPPKRAHTLCEPSGRGELAKAGMLSKQKQRQSEHSAKAHVRHLRGNAARQACGCAEASALRPGRACRTSAKEAIARPHLSRRGSSLSIGQKEDAVKADRAKVEKLLKTAKGQLDGILRMVEEDRYCIDISNQILAAQAVLNRANKEILKAHMEMCVNHAVETGDSQQKMAELYSLLDKILK